jgi:ABC-type lipoprotein export system ATPase subunit
MEALMNTQSTHDGHLIQLEALTRVYPTPAGPVTVLQDVNVNIASGQLAAITGKSGSGKSTLLNLLTGIDRPTSGHVVIGGEAIHDLNEDQRAAWRGRNLGIVFQFFQLIPTLTVLENVLLPMELSGSIPARQRKARALALLEQVDIHAQADKFPMTLSGGQQQRAAIARALANDPGLLVADEPTGNLDSQTATQVFDLFCQLAAQGKTVVMVTHDRELAARADQVIPLADGKIQ